MSKIIFGFIGPPGSGKSTQAKLLAEALGCKVLNIGEKLRESQDPKLLAIMKSGELVPDEYILKIIVTTLKNLPEDAFLVLDGFFRRASEVVVLAAEERKLHLQIGGIFDLQLSYEMAKERLGKRGRLDDGAKDVGVRFQVFEREREGILSVAKEEKVRIFKIDGSGTVDFIRDRVLEELKEYIN